MEPWSHGAMLTPGFITVLLCIMGDIMKTLGSCPYSALLSHHCEHLQHQEEDIISGDKHNPDVGTHAGIIPIQFHWRYLGKSRLN